MKEPIERRTFLKAGAMALGAAAMSELKASAEEAAPVAGSPVYFTQEISVEGLRKIYAKINEGIGGKVAIKLHTGEPHGPNLLPVELIRGLQSGIPHSSIVECNVLYPSPRQKTETHLETVRTNGFDFCPVDIMDAEDHVMLPVNGMREFFDSVPPFTKQKLPFTPGAHLYEVAVGKNMLHYDSMLVYTHFKGHTMGGFGGSLKNIGIGCASGQLGKRQIHGEGWPRGEEFLERMVESGKGIADHFSGHITYINVLKNISVDCDCDAHGAKPTMGDIGILGSRDILAIDQASVDMVFARPEEERKDLMERINSRHGLHQLEYMKALKMGNDKYNLIEL